MGSIPAYIEWKKTIAEESTPSMDGKSLIPYRAEIRSELYEDMKDQVNIDAKPTALALIARFCRGVIDTVDKTNVSEFLEGGKFHNPSIALAKRLEGVHRNNDPLSESVFGTAKEKYSRHMGMTMTHLGGDVAAAKNGLFDPLDPFSIYRLLDEKHRRSLSKVARELRGSYREDDREKLATAEREKKKKFDEELNLEVARFEKRLESAYRAFAGTERATSKEEVEEVVKGLVREAAGNRRLKNKAKPVMDYYKSQVNLYVQVFDFTEFKVVWKRQTIVTAKTHLYSIITKVEENEIEIPTQPIIPQSKVKIEVKKLGPRTIEGLERERAEHDRIEAARAKAAVAAAEAPAPSSGGGPRAARRGAAPVDMGELKGKAILMAFQVELDEEEVVRDEWIQCECCDRWHMVPPGWGAAADLPDDFKCGDATWNTGTDLVCRGAGGGGGGSGAAGRKRGRGEEDGEVEEEEEEEEEKRLLWFYGDVVDVASRTMKVGGSNVRKGFVHVRWNRDIYNDDHPEAFEWLHLVKKNYNKLDDPHGWVVTAKRTFAPGAGVAPREGDGGGRGGGGVSGGDVSEDESFDSASESEDEGAVGNESVADESESDFEDEVEARDVMDED